MLNFLTILLLFLGTIQVINSFIPQRNISLRRKTLVAVNYLYREEPTEVEREEMKNLGNPKHSSFHVEKGPVSIDDKTDPAHSIHHHLIDVDHDKLNDLSLRAQKAWTPVDVHEMDVDAVTAAAVLFGLMALILFSVQK
eukprot:241758_1